MRQQILFREYNKKKLVTIHNDLPVIRHIELSSSLPTYPFRSDRAVQSVAELDLQPHPSLPVEVEPEQERGKSPRHHSSPGHFPFHSPTWAFQPQSAAHSPVEIPRG